MSSIEISVGDITKSDCECIVNAANRSLLGGGGVDGAIHRAAGPSLLEECRLLRGCNTGDAKITGGHKLRAKYIIHTVGPIYSGIESDEKLLSSCYLKSLITARLNNIHSIAFPAISTGAYGYPHEEAARIAVQTVANWLTENSGYDMRVVFQCFDTAMRDCYMLVVDRMDKRVIGLFAGLPTARTVEMRLAPLPYAQMASGEKTVDVRLFDEKRRGLRIGDVVRFYRGDSYKESVCGTIIGLHRFDSFIELFSSSLLPLTGSGNMTASEAAESMYKFYTEENETRYGVVGIELRLLRE